MHGKILSRCALLPAKILCAATKIGRRQKNKYKGRSFLKVLWTPMRVSLTFAGQTKTNKYIPEGSLDTIHSWILTGGGWFSRQVVSDSL